MFELTKYLKHIKSPLNKNYEGYTQEQLYEISEGLKSGVDISKYAKIEFSAIMMRVIRLALEEKLDISEIDYSKIDVDVASELHELMTININIDKYKEGYSSKQLYAIRDGYARGYDVSLFDDKKFSSEQMYAIIKGIKDGVDVMVLMLQSIMTQIHIMKL